MKLLLLVLPAAQHHSGNRSDMMLSLPVLAAVQYQLGNRSDML